MHPLIYSPADLATFLGSIILCVLFAVILLAIAGAIAVGVIGTAWWAAATAFRAVFRRNKVAGPAS